jgi:hypothetical protein
MDLNEQFQAPASVRCALALRENRWDEAHRLADSGENRDLYYWHAIVHRQEPDPANAAYWFRKVGTHPIFKDLREQAAALGYNAGPAWDAFAFINYSGPLKGQIEALEWQLLYDWCACQ